MDAKTKREARIRRHRRVRQENAGIVGTARPSPEGGAR